MTKETGRSPSYQELQERKTRLEGIIKSRSDLAERFSRIRGRLLGSAKRHGVALFDVNQRIEQVEEESFVQKAQEHFTRVEQLELMIEQAGKLGLSKRTLMSLQGELREVHAQADFNVNPELFRGVEILRQRERGVVVEAPVQEVALEVIREIIPSQREERERVLPKLVVDEKTQEVEVDGRRVKIGSQIDRSVFLHLARNPREDISSRQLDRIALGAGSRSATGSAGRSIFNLRKFFEEDPKNPQLLITVGFRPRRRENTQYRLEAEVEFVGVVLPKERFREARKLFGVSLPDGQLVQVEGKLTAQALERLAQTSKDNPIGTEELIQILYGAEAPYEQSRKKAQLTLSRVKEIVEPLGYQIVQATSGRAFFRGERGFYYLERIVSPEVVSLEKEVTPAAPNGEEKPRGSWEEPLFESKQRALEAFLENSQIPIKRIIEILGPRKDGKPLHRGQVRWALDRNGVGFLYFRIIRYKNEKIQAPITREELELWERIKSFTGQTEDVATLKLFREKFGSWLEQQRAITKREVAKLGAIEQERIEPFSGEEVAILANSIKRRGEGDGTTIIKPDGTKFQFKSEDISDLCQRLIEKFPLTRENYTELRQRTLERLGKFLTGAKLDEFLGQRGDDDQETFLIWLYCQDQDQMENLLNQFLSEPTELVYRLEWGQPVENVQQVWISPKEKRLQIERRDPQVRERAREFLGEIEEKRMVLPVNSAQLTRVFPRSKETHIEKMIEKGYIKPKKRNGLNVFNIEEIAVLLYTHDYGNNLNTHLVRQLKTITREEITKKEENR